MALSKFLATKVAHKPLETDMVGHDVPPEAKSVAETLLAVLDRAREVFSIGLVCPHLGQKRIQAGFLFCCQVQSGSVSIIVSWT